MACKHGEAAIKAVGGAHCVGLLGVCVSTRDQDLGDCRGTPSLVGSRERAPCRRHTNAVGHLALVRPRHTSPHKCGRPPSTGPPTPHASLLALVVRSLLSLNNRVMDRAPLSPSLAHPAAPADQVMADATQRQLPPAGATPSQVHMSHSVRRA
eukprot:scaffold71285_cov30-Tisochrysis_lutea.AAC.1